MQGFGILAGGVVTLALSASFRRAFPAPAYLVDAFASTVPQADYVWRAILMLGAAPAGLTYYCRTKMPETSRYTALVAGNAKQAASDMSRVLQVEIEAEAEKLDQITRGSDYGLFSSRTDWRTASGRFGKGREARHSHRAVGVHAELPSASSKGRDRRR